MAVPLGRRDERAGVVDLLVECHGRIRDFLAMAEQVATRADLRPEDVADGCARVERYFTLALPLHVRDEEESLLPRLSGRDPAVDQALATMRAQHGEHEAPLRALLAALDALRRAPADEARRRALGERVVALARDFAAHLEAEEAVIFPALARLVPAAAQADIVGEMRARRRG